MLLHLEAGCSHVALSGKGQTSGLIAIFRMLLAATSRFRAFGDDQVAEQNDEQGDGAGLEIRFIQSVP